MLPTRCLEGSVGACLDTEEGGVAAGLPAAGVAGAEAVLEVLVGVIRRTSGAMLTWHKSSQDTRSVNVSTFNMSSHYKDHQWRT